MAWTSLVKDSTAGNVKLNIDYNIVSAERTSNTNVKVTFGIRFSMSTNTYTENSIAAFVDGAIKWAFNSNSGASHTNKGTYYYATNSTGTHTTESSPLTKDISVSLTQTSASFTVGYGWNKYTPTQVGSSSITVTFPTGATTPTGLSCSLSSITEDRATLNGSYSSDGGASVTSSGFQYHASGGSWASFSNNSTALSPNTKYWFRYYATNSQGTSYSSEITATTYNNPYLTSAPNFTIGNTLSIGFYNPLNRDVYIYIINPKGTEQGGDHTTGTSISGYTNATWQNFFYAGIPTSKTGTYKVRLVCSQRGIDTTSNGGTYSIKNSSDEKPTFTSSYITNVQNTAYTSIAGNNKFIEGHNTLTGSITPMIGNKSATPDKYIISSSGIDSVEKSYSSSAQSFQLNNIKNGTISISAYDKRGLYTSTSISVDYVPYSKPSVSTSRLVRQNGIGTAAIITFTGKYTNWSGLSTTNNIQTIKYRTKLTSASWSGVAWKTLPTSATITSSSGTWSLNATLSDTFATTSNYNLQLQITDKLDVTETSDYLISTADAFIWRDLANKRLGINKKPDYPLDVNGDIKSNNVRTGNVILSGQAQRSSGGSWIKARDNAVVMQTRHTTSAGSSWNPVACVKTAAGSWSIGNVGNEILAFSHDTDADYNAGNNNHTVYALNSGGGGDIITSDILLDKIYPVGSFYISGKSTSPASLFGGSWTRVSGRFLYAYAGSATKVGKDSVSTYTGGTTTGVALGTSQIPAHDHGSKTLTGTIRFRAATSGSNIADAEPAGQILKYTEDGGAVWSQGLNYTSGSNKPTDLIAINATHTHSSVGSGGTHAHYVPWIDVYVWERIS